MKQAKSAYKPVLIDQQLQSILMVGSIHFRQQLDFILTLKNSLSLINL